SLHESGFGNIIVQPNVKKALEYYIQAATKQHEPSMMKVGEILGGMLGCHEEAIHWFKKTSRSYPENVMAKVMLISYELQGFDCGLSVESNKDTSNFKLLRHIVAQYNTDESNQEDLLQDKEEEEEEENPLSRRRNELCSKKNGMGHAYYILGQCYEFGRGTSVDLLASIDAYEIAVSSCDHIDAMWRLGMVYSYRFDDDSSALDWFRKASEKARHRDSHYQLGLFHLRGRGGLEINLAAAKRYFTKAAEQNHAMATYELARILWTIDSSHLKAYELFERAAQQNVPGALCHLGHFSYTGLYYRSICVVEKDLQKAFAYYSEAAQAGDPIAALMVGSHFEDKGNLDRALQWYESSYRLGGGGLAELAIGKIKHCMSQTDPHAQEEAIAWFESAAADDMLKRQSVFSAHVMIALYHLNGWGNRDKDSQKGFQMLLKIANMGGTEVFSLLAECYKEGIGKEHHQDNTSNLEKAASDEA
ncbi:ERAD-associated E3 ubiquitin-protein ligase component HRD3A, partial [Choanephora cucurbitarum]